MELLLQNGIFYHVWSFCDLDLWMLENAQKPYVVFFDFEMFAFLWTCGPKCAFLPTLVPFVTLSCDLLFIPENTQQPR